MPKKREWTEAEAAQARLLYEEQRRGLAETAAALRSCPKTVKALLQLLEIRVRPMGPPRRPRTWTPERCERARELYEDGMSLDEVGQQLGSTRAKTALAVRRAGGVIRRRGARTEHNVFWRGGRTIDQDGYVLVKSPNHPSADRQGYVREHRLVMEAVLGRSLSRSEVVHHKNKVREDNRPENLELFETNGAHLERELAGRCPKWTEGGKERIRAAHARRANPNSPWLNREYRNARAREQYAKRMAERKAAPQSPIPDRPTSGDSE